MKIGIAISHHNRHDVLKKALDAFATLGLPSKAELIVIDDASDDPTNMANYRFEHNVGIARTKNKGIELLMAAGCTDLFLFDDDTYPIAKDWWKPYVDSKEKHLMLNFAQWSNGNPVGDDTIVYMDDKIKAHAHPRGCMLYMTREVIDRVGGFNTGFGKAMEEHVEYSQRVFNAGLTTFKFADVNNSSSLIYSTDWDKSTRLVSSIKPAERANWRRNKGLLEQLKYDDTFHPYAEIQTSFDKRIVLTTYFTSGVDTQRNITWEADQTKIQPLIDSVVKHGENIVILNDCGWNEKGEGFEFIDVPSFGNPYFWRWYAEYLFLRENDYDVAWLVDATDVEMLENPFRHMQSNTLYSGDEPGQIGNNRWLQNKSSNMIRGKFYASRKPILNCGVVGGSSADLMELCRAIWEMYTEDKMQDTVEMPIYNYLLLDRPVVHGAPVNTVFKQFETNTEGIWWKHK